MKQLALLDVKHGETMLFTMRRPRGINVPCVSFTAQDRNGAAQFTDVSSEDDKARKRILSDVKSGRFPRDLAKRKVKRTQSGKPPMSRRKGATVYQLREALKRQTTDAFRKEYSHRFSSLQSAEADQLYDALYAWHWCQSWGRPLSEWRGLLTETNAPDTQNLFTSSGIDAAGKDAA